MDSSGLLNDEDCNRRLGYICSYTPTSAGEYWTMNVATHLPILVGTLLYL